MVNPPGNGINMEGGDAVFEIGRVHKGICLT